jgi:type IV pilus assembly protein PilC
MTARQIAKWGLIGWVSIVLIQIVMASQDIESPFPFQSISTLFFVAIFAQYVYDWTRLRSETEDRVLFLLEFADLLRLSIPPAEALSKLVSVRSRQYSHRFSGFTRTLREVSERVNAGEPIDSAFREVRGVPNHWGSFSQFCEDPERLASLMESLAQAERTHLTFPYLSAIRIQLLLPMVLGISVFVQTYIMPTFVELFKGMNLTLPLPTKVLLGFNDFINTTKLDVALMVIVLALVMVFSSDKSLKAAFRYLFYVPVGRTLVKLSIQSQIFRMIGAGLGFGVPLRDCLQAAADNADVRAYKTFLSTCSENQSDSFSQQISRAPHLFSSHLTWLVQQGELLENLPGALLTASEIAHQEVEQKIRRVEVYLDTLILLIIGLYVGLTMVSLFLPLYTMMDHL